MQLHSKPGFIFYNNFDSGIYYSTSEYERSSSTILSQYRPGQWGIYLIKHFTSLSFTEIGQLFKLDYSAVSQAAKRFEQEIKVNHKMGEIK
jgi:chromosomal replication initiation ATPase DnaA